MWAVPTNPGLPSDAGTQQQLGVAGDQLQDLHQFDVENVPDGRDDFVEEFLQIAVGQCALAEPRQRFLLARANANLAVDAQPFGDVAAHAEHLHRGAVLDDDRDERLEPALIAVRASGQTVFETARLVGLQGFVDRGKDAGGILRWEVSSARSRANRRCCSREARESLRAGSTTSSRFDRRSQDHTPTWPASSADRNDSSPGGKPPPGSEIPAFADSP